MEPNLYAPPTAAVVAPAGPGDRSDTFYIVSARKCGILFFATFGVYQLYWAYRHWARYRAASGEYLWPLARTLFSIFYTHALTARIEAVLLKTGRHYPWSPGAVATAYVLARVVSIVLDRLNGRDIGSPWTNVLGVLILLPIGWAVLRIQRAANVACGDPLGESNDRLSAANYAWIAFGAVLWLLILLSLAFSFGYTHQIEIKLPTSQIDETRA